jgi:prepilin signal peptidase PulO-like enzyme (type II secretory pathway)
LVELLTASLFVVSYIWWPFDLHGFQVGVFVWWLLLLVGLMALTVYDLRWYLLPIRILYPSGVAGFVMTFIAVINADSPARAILNAVLAVAIGGGIFYVLFQVSKGKWIGGGDVKLGWLLGLVAGTPGRAVLFIFIGSVLGSLVSVPLLANGRMKRSSVIPFGPFLIAGLVITVLFGADILNWYQRMFIPL